MDFKNTRDEKLIDKINSRIKDCEKFYSLEFFPPRTPGGTYNLYEKCERLSLGRPLFCDVTCNVNKEDSKESCRHFVKLASVAQNIIKSDTVLQLNASQLTEDSAEDVLSNARQKGISTVMVISGNMMKGRKNDYDDEFSCSADLVRFIRKTYQDDFTICVAGYPSCTSSKKDVTYEQTFEHLLSEIKYGADFIITQVIFDANEFIDFVTKCHEWEITVPIMPGILPIQSFGCIKQLQRYSKVKVPNRIMNVLSPIQNNDAAVMKYGIELTARLCKTLLKNPLCHGLHFFTLNREVATTQVLKQIGLWQEDNSNLSPWQPPFRHGCHDEGFSSLSSSPCRSENYMNGTPEQGEFPNGRWGDSSMAAFGRFRDYGLFYAESDGMIFEQRRMWGSKLTCIQDINNVFVSFLTGENNKDGYKVTQIPWSDDDLAPETGFLSRELTEMNANGFLSINSQPNVSCAPSHDLIYGWGNPGGYVFQKAYLEFFCSEEDGTNMLEILKQFPNVNYHIINNSGTKNHTNADSGTNPVTWGVFSGQMVLQPTVVDPVAFQFWKDEAFEIWLQQWGRLYEEENKSRDLIRYVHDTYFLVNLVDNDYVKGNCLFDIINKVMLVRSAKNTSLEDSMEHRVDI